VAVADLDEKRRESFARQYSVPQQYADYHDLLANASIDAISIALPNFLHHPAAIAALAAGKHVLCEKPPAINLVQAQEMEAAATRAGKLLVYAVQRRFKRSTDLLLERLASNALGDVYHARAVWTRAWGVPRGTGNWFTDPSRAGGGALIDIGVHVLDWAWFLMGCPQPVTVSGQVFNRFPELTKTDDSAFALVRFEDGRSLHVEASWVLMQESDQMGVHLYGTAGGARIDDGNLDLFQVGQAGRVRTSIALEGGLPAFLGQAANFLAAIRGTEAPRTPAAHGTLLMAMIEAVYRSAREGREVLIQTL
jgi:predicted dehydrogenase